MHLQSCMVELISHSETCTSKKLRNSNSIICHYMPEPSLPQHPLLSNTCRFLAYCCCSSQKSMDAPAEAEAQAAPSAASATSSAAAWQEAELLLQHSLGPRSMALLPLCSKDALAVAQTAASGQLCAAAAVVMGLAEEPGSTYLQHRFARRGDRHDLPHNKGDIVTYLECVVHMCI